MNKSDEEVERGEESHQEDLHRGEVIAHELEEENTSEEGKHKGSDTNRKGAATNQMRNCAVASGGWSAIRPGWELRVDFLKQAQGGTYDHPNDRVSSDGRFFEVGWLPDLGLQNLGSRDDASGPPEGAPTSPPWRRLDGVTGPESSGVLHLSSAPSSAVQLNPEARAAVIESVRHRLLACGSDARAKGHVLQWAKDATGWSERELAAALGMSRPYVYRLIRERHGDAVKRDAPGLRPTTAAVDRHAARLISGKVEVEAVLELVNACGRLMAAYLEILVGNAPSPQKPFGEVADADMPRSQAGQG